MRRVLLQGMLLEDGYCVRALAEPVRSSGELQMQKKKSLGYLLSGDKEKNLHFILLVV